jgi:hypothetical protein
VRRPPHSAISHLQLTLTCVTLLTLPPHTCVSLTSVVPQDPPGGPPVRRVALLLPAVVGGQHARHGRRLVRCPGDQGEQGGQRAARDKGGGHRVGGRGPEHSEAPWGRSIRLGVING